VNPEIEFSSAADDPKIARVIARAIGILFLAMVVLRPFAWPLGIFGGIAIYVSFLRQISRINTEAKTLTQERFVGRMKIGTKEISLSNATSVCFTFFPAGSMSKRGPRGMSLCDQGDLHIVLGFSRKILLRVGLGKNTQSVKNFGEAVAERLSLPFEEAEE
jgi:hypothetical protein